MRPRTKKILKYTIFGGIATGAGVILYLTFKTNVKVEDARKYQPKYFQFADLFKSAKADAYGIDNTTDDETINNNLKALCKAVVDPALEEYERLYGKPNVTVNSGYRNAEVNRLANGQPTSQRTKGEAVDLTLGSKENNRRLFDIVKKQAKFDQLINEYDYRWCHISFKRTGYNRQSIVKEG